METLYAWAPFMGAWLAVVGLLAAVAPLAIWSHTARLARTAERQEALLKEIGGLLAQIKRDL